MKNNKFKLYESLFNLFLRISKLPDFLFDKSVDLSNKLFVIAMVIYVLSPFDIIPEFLVGFGFIDDIVITIFFISKISSYLDKYIESSKEGEGEEIVLDSRDYEIDDE